MNLFGQKGDPLEALNNSEFVTDGASVGEQTQLRLIDGACQNKRTDFIIHIVTGSVETMLPVDGVSHVKEKQKQKKLTNRWCRVVEEITLSYDWPLMLPDDI